MANQKFGEDSIVVYSRIYPILKCYVELAHTDQLLRITNSNKPQLPIYENNNKL